jgi:thiamine-monophosphate kinase
VLPGGEPHGASHSTRPPRAPRLNVANGEFDLIRQYFTRPAPAGVLGVGDDCALLPAAPGATAISTDLLIEGRHFFPDVDPESLGHKSLAVNLSDLAAMGAQPSAFVLGLALPRVDEAWLAAFSRGLFALADAHHCALIGGDTTRAAGGLVISITIFGNVDPALALRRGGAQEGDDIWVSGHLGAADIALRLLDGRAGDIPAARRDTILVQTRAALERPQPRVALGLALRGIASAAIDISDGLLQDLGHVLNASGRRAQLRVDDLPLAPALAGLPQRLLRHAALGGGDVYELCFTAASARRQQVLQAAAQAGVAVTRVGHVVAGADTARLNPTPSAIDVIDAQGLTVTDLPAGGFDHFAQSP